MATFTYLTSRNAGIANLSGSGLGFYGDAGFAASVAVGNYQGRTFVTDSTGALQGAEADNLKYLNSGSGIIGQTGSGVGLANIPNERCSLISRFTHSSAVKITNCKAYFGDRTSKNNNPSGVTIKAAELIHPSSSQLEVGSGDTTWITPAGTGTYLSLCPSPGPSGLYAGNGANSLWAADTHEHFLAISVSPDQIGGCSFALFCELEFF